MGFNGYTAALPDDVLLDSGVLFVGNAAIGVTVGNPKFDPGREEREIQFDGLRSPIQGNEAIARYRPVITATIIQLTDANINRLDPGNTLVTTGVAGVDEVKTYTGLDAGQFFDLADYIVNLRLIFKRKSGKYAGILFPVARCRKWDLAGEDNGEAKINVEFIGVIAAGTSQAELGNVPYAIELRDALPTA